MEGKSLIKYSVIIVAILLVVFLGQQAYFREMGKTLVSATAGQAAAYLAKGSNWVTSAIYQKISGLPEQAGQELQKRGEAIQNEVAQQVEQQKEKISENILDKTKNYFSGISDSILHPGENNCLPAQSGATPSSQTSTGQ